MKSKIEIIKETANYYNSNNRAYANGTCDYISSDGNKCAVGRCIREDKIGLIQLTYKDKSIEEENFNIFELYFKDDYKGHDWMFWQDLQIFHDQSCNWNENGLTTQGEVELMRLLHKYQGE